MATSKDQWSPQLTRLHEEATTASAEPVVIREVPNIEIPEGEGGHTTPQPDGSHVIELPEGYGEELLAHELLHVLYYRSGYPTLIVRGQELALTMVATALGQFPEHIRLHAELRDRGFNSTEYWAGMVAEIPKWSHADKRKVDADTIINAAKLATTLRCSWVDPESVRAEASDRYPHTLALAKQLMSATADIDVSAKPPRIKRALNDMIDLADRAIKGRVGRKDFIRSSVRVHFRGDPMPS